jgi:hypothetical protein
MTLDQFFDNIALIRAEQVTTPEIRQAPEPISPAHKPAVQGKLSFGVGRIGASMTMVGPCMRCASAPGCPLLLLSLYY